MAAREARQLVGDAEAVELCRQGDEEGFRALLDAHQTYVFTLCWRLLGGRQEAVDLTQEVFLRVIRALPGLRPQPSLRPWLRRVTVNLCSHHRQSGVRGAALEDRLREQSGSRAAVLAKDPVGEAVAARDEVDRVGELLRRLSPAHRTALVLNVVEDLSCPQIAEIMGLPVGTVKSHLSRARARLRQALADQGGG